MITLSVLHPDRTTAHGQAGQAGQQCVMCLRENVNTPRPAADDCHCCTVLAQCRTATDQWPGWHGDFACAVPSNGWAKAHITARRPNVLCCNTHVCQVLGFAAVVLA